MIGWTKKNREKIEENAFEQTKKKPGLNSNPVLELFWAFEQLGPGQVRGRDPFNQNFRKFRSKTQWIGSVQPEKLRKNWSTFWGGQLFLVEPVWVLVEWIAPRILWDHQGQALQILRFGVEIGRIIYNRSKTWEFTKKLWISRQVCLFLSKYWLSRSMLAR